MKDIDAALAGRLISAQFPQWAHLPIRPVEHDGWDNRTFRLGGEMSVRLPAAARYAAQVEKEQRWLPKLAPFLPLAIPVPLAMGAPGEGYPWPWSVYRWLPGRHALLGPIDDRCEFATALAAFLTALRGIDLAGGPSPGPHNFHRGGRLAAYDGETRSAIASRNESLDVRAVTGVWEAALSTAWREEPVWFHGDICAANLLVKGGRLRAVIDFGLAGVGDPACDLTIAWTFLVGESGEVFRRAVHLDDDTWARARGWALWKALITLDSSDPLGANKARSTIERVVADHAAAGG